MDDSLLAARCGHIGDHSLRAVVLKRVTVALLALVLAVTERPAGEEPIVVHPVLLALAPASLDRAAKLVRAWGVHTVIVEADGPRIVQLEHGLPVGMGRWESHGGLAAHLEVQGARIPRFLDHEERNDVEDESVVDLKQLWGRQRRSPLSGHVLEELLPLLVLDREQGVGNVVVHLAHDLVVPFIGVPHAAALKDVVQSKVAQEGDHVVEAPEPLKGVQHVALHVLRGLLVRIVGAPVEHDSLAHVAPGHGVHSLGVGAGLEKDQILAGSHLELESARVVRALLQHQQGVEGVDLGGAAVLSVAKDERLLLLVAVRQRELPSLEVLSLTAQVLELHELALPSNGLREHGGDDHIGWGLLEKGCLLNPVLLPAGEVGLRFRLGVHGVLRRGLVGLAREPGG